MRLLVISKFCFLTILSRDIWLLMFYFPPVLFTSYFHKFIGKVFDNRKLFSHHKAMLFKAHALKNITLGCGDQNG